MSYRWEELTPGQVRDLYNRRAKLYPLYERLFWVPPGIRGRMIQALSLKPGNTVLELGCGRGKNIPRLCHAVGPNGSYVGVDVSEHMLHTASKVTRAYPQAHLVACDALEFAAEHLFDAILFSLSYHVMPLRQQVLARAWDMLGPGGKVVVFDAKPPPGRLGQVALRVFEGLVHRTVLGNPHIRAWVDLAQYDPLYTLEEYQLGSYYIAIATKR